MHESPPSAGSQPVLAAPAQRRNAAFYALPVAPLAAPHAYTLAQEQLSAWRLQLPSLRTTLEDLPIGTSATPPLTDAPHARIHNGCARIRRSSVPCDGDVTIAFQKGIKTVLLA